jgi:hypothetical protein
MALQLARESMSVGKATITLLFEDGTTKEHGNIVLSCDQAGFKALLESLVIESRKHAVKNAELKSGLSSCASNVATSSILFMQPRRRLLEMAVRIAAVQTSRWRNGSKI